MHLFQLDHEVPATRVLFDTDAMAARIRPWFGTGNLSLSISNIRYKPNTSCLVSYQIETENGHSYCHVKAFQKTNWQIRKRKLVQKQASSHAANDVLIDDEYAFAFVRFPSDFGLPGIARFVSDPQGFLSSVMFQNCGSERFSGFEPLAYKPNRRFTAKLGFESGDPLVLKIHDALTIERTLKSARILKMSSLVDMPERVGRSNRHRTLVYKWIDGTNCDLATIANGECRSLIESVLGFLERLHSGCDVANKSLPVQLPAEGIDPISRYLAGIYPPVAERVRKICDKILANLQLNNPLTLIHGDLHEGQIILAGDEVKACDFDNCCLGDPTTDLANFVAHLHFRASLNEISMAKVAQINDWSIRYFADDGDRTALNRFLWNQLAGMLRLTTHPFRSGTAAWMEQTEAFVSHIEGQIELVKNTFHAKTYTSFKRRDGRNVAHGPTAQERDNQDSNLSSVGIQNDRRLEFLAEAFDSFAADRAIEQLDPPLDEIYDRYEIIDIIARRHKPGRRCLVEYELATSTGRRSILGKASAKRLDQKAFDTQSDLYSFHGFGGNSADRIRVPRPLGCFAPWRMWFQEKVCATSGASILENGQLGSVTDRIANAIAKLHSSGFSPFRKHSVTDELNILRDRLQQASAELPAQSHRIERVLKNCISIAEAIDDNKSVPIHRDFYHDQIMFSGQQTYLVDLDLVSTGHPALDMGNFLAHLTEHAVRRFDDQYRWIDEEIEIANHYLARMPNVLSSEIAAFKAISFARHIHISRVIKDRRMMTTKIIDVAEQLTSDSSQKLKIS